MENVALEPVRSSAKLCSSPELIEAICAFEEWSLANVPQADVPTEHLLHGGLYARTIRIPADVVLTGVTVKIPTILVIHGDADVLTGDGWTAVSGFGVLAGSAFRKQIFVTRSAVEMTMVFPTQARTVDEAEREFTDEFEKLTSRKIARSAGQGE